MSQPLTGLTLNCLLCLRSFYAPSWLLKRGGGKFCSHPCYATYKINNTSPNKGQIKKGQHLSPRTEIKPSRRIYTGDLKEYKNLHYRIGKRLGKPSQCTSCRQEFEGKKIHWANKSGNYLEKTSDWLRLCAKCHQQYDRIGVYAHA